jgi:sec-independent protein translocase protein TatB
MFDLTSGKLLLLGIVALIVLGPKDFPILLRTIGKYMGMIKRQADEFRDQFNEAIRESEFDQIKKDVEGLGKDLDATVRDTQESVTKELGSVTQEFETVRHDIDAQLNDPLKPSPHTDSYTPIGIEDQPAPAATEGAASTPAPEPGRFDANDMPITQAEPAPSVAPAQVASAAPVEKASLNGSGHHPEHAREASEPAVKSGA